MAPSVMSVGPSSSGAGSSFRPYRPRDRAAPKPRWTVTAPPTTLEAGVTRCQRGADAAAAADALVGRRQRDAHVLASGRAVEVAGGREDAAVGQPLDRRPAVLPRAWPRGRGPPRSRRRADRTPRRPAAGGAARGVPAFCSTRGRRRPGRRERGRCTGHGTIIPACLRTSSSRPTSAGSPATKAAR